ncbi:MarR family winged helix-turn-helix transcriptional regulator [Dactylosporangium matsuzakiense]|uniref:MarR family transcriptional regulator n=1 Tax=Dactylosporangium matsuzakiense TaxID=53360 RepID=A0A9W6KL10_9ACTN|nr:MarR family winged helix-turn-helix transcriptional regulator [Dactylosporangium matsuzakiense]GLL02226.1 MarR family transcriptional regulator [Dactylosporangium matsuzakiense]
MDDEGASAVPGAGPASQLLLGLARLGQAVRIDARRNAGVHNLSPLQADIVGHLGSAQVPLRQGELVEALASTAPTVSDAVKALRRKELLVVSADPGDARVLRLALSDAGRAEAARLAEVSPTLAGAVDALGEEDFAAMLRGTVALMRELQQRRAIPVSRMCVTCRFFVPDAHPAATGRPHHCNFVDAPFGDAALRVSCPDHQPREV